MPTAIGEGERHGGDDPAAVPVERLTHDPRHGGRIKPHPRQRVVTHSMAVAV
jgi:hypothetical protein